MVLGSDDGMLQRPDVVQAPLVMDNDVSVLFSAPDQLDPLASVGEETRNHMAWDMDMEFELFRRVLGQGASCLPEGMCCIIISEQSGDVQHKASTSDGTCLA